MHKKEANTKLDMYKIIRTTTLFIIQNYFFSENFKSTGEATSNEKSNQGILQFQF